MSERFTDFCKKYNIGPVPKQEGAPAMDSVTRRIDVLERELAAYIPPDEEPTRGQ